MAYQPNNSNGQATMANSTPVVIASNQTSIPVTMSNTLALTDTQIRATALPVTLNSDADNTSTGTLALSAQTVVLLMGGKSTSAVSISGTWVGIITFEGSVDGTIWDSINAVAATTSAPQPTTTVNGLYRLSPAGLLQIRVIMTTYTSGTANISMRVSAGAGAIFANQILPSRITDGINTTTIKPASTASTATDLPLVVALHPSSATPNFATTQPVSVVASSNRVGSVQLTGSATAAALGLGSSVTAYGNLRVTAEPTNIFNDPFDGPAIDVTNRWNVPVISGMTIAQTSGDLVTTTTTTNGNSAFIDTIPTFAPLGISFIVFAAASKLEAQTANFFALNQHRFWGFGNRPTTFNTTTPLLDAIGFEIGIDGQLYCVVYEAGVNRFRSSISLTGVNLNTLVSPSSGYVRFGMAVRADTIIFYINSTEFPAQSFTVSSVGFTMPDVQTLPIRIATVNAATGIVGASTFIISTLALGDTGGTGHSIIDGIHGFRKQTVKAPSTAAAATDSPAIVALHPSSPIPLPTITKGTQGTTGVTTQDLKDAGRSSRTITLDSFAVAATAETLITMSYSSDNGTLTTGSSYTVTAGKRFRIQSIIASTHTITGNTTIANVIVRIRVNNAGAALISSPVQFIQPIYGTASVNQSAIHSAISIQDGWEFVGGAGIAVTIACSGFVATTAAPKVDITIIGYEY